MDYSIQRSYTLVDKQIGFTPYTVSCSEDKMMELKIEYNFNKVIPEDDFWQLIKESGIMEDAMADFDQFINKNEADILEKLQEATYEQTAYNGFNRRHDRHKISFSVLYKKEHNTISDVKERLQKLYEEYRPKKEENETNLHPDLVIRLNEYLNENKEDVLKEHGQTVYEFLTQVKGIHVYESTDPNWGSDYQVIVETNEGQFSFSFMNDFPAESDVEHFKTDENDSIHTIFAEIPILWD